MGIDNKKPDFLVKSGFLLFTLESQNGSFSQACPELAEGNEPFCDLGTRSRGLRKTCGDGVHKFVGCGEAGFWFFCHRRDNGVGRAKGDVGNKALWIGGRLH